MASLNLSINGASIKSSYAGVVNAPAPPADSPSAYAQWALFSVQAPLANAFQDSGNKESVLKVQSTGEGLLDELVEDFNEGRIQFAFVKVKDPNTGLPKYALIAWCGGGVPERTKGYFTSHVNAVSKVLHGYHVQITARSDSDVEPANILQKVADASGAKYTAGGSAPVSSSGPPPPVKSKPVFASASGSSSFNPIIAARNQSLKSKDDDGWGDAPDVSRSELQKVESAYKPTKVNIAELRGQAQEPSRFNGSNRPDEDRSHVIGGSYQPVGKIDISAIRAAAKGQQDDRPTTVKGAYEPVGKVDIAAIRARAKPADEAPAPEPTDAPIPSLSERSAAFHQSERITELPKPKVAKKFGAAASFTGTKAPTPGGVGGFGSPAPAAAAPIGAASRTFADQGGKTPAQIWAEKKAKQGGSQSNISNPPVTSPVQPQTSGGAGWQSGYTGKSWGPVQTGSYGRGIAGEKSEETVSSQDDASAAPGGGVSAMRDHFKDAAPIGMAAPSLPSAPRPPAPAEEEEEEEEAAPPPPPPAASRPPPAAGGFALPGMPPRPPPADEEEEEEEEEEPEPIRVAMPVSRGPEPEPEPVPEPTHTLPVRSIPEPPVEEKAPPAPAAAVDGGVRALIQYDYEPAEDNEIELKENDYVTDIDMIDEDWWMGTNSAGNRGLFPSNYVTVEEDDGGHAAAAPAAPEPAAPASHAAPEPEPEAAGGATATAVYDYEAAEDNELSFPENAKITDVEFPDEDWWFGHYNGASGLFPSNYVQLDQ